MGLSKFLGLCLSPVVAIASHTVAAQAQSNAAGTSTTLRVATWGGAYGSAQQKAILKPVQKELKINIEAVAAVRGNSGDTDADVVEVGLDDLLKGCESGKLQKLGSPDLKPGAQAEAAADDFIEGGLSDCGVASFAWSSVFLVDRTKFPKRAPKNLSDVFDAKAFQGKRAIIKRAENLFEFLAAANNAAPGDVYEALSNRETLDDVVAKLEGLLPNVIWVDGPAAALEKLKSGEAAIAMGFSGRAFRKTLAGSVSAIWGRHVYHFTSWAIPAKARDVELGKSFIALATSPELLAAQARLWPYGPMRKSAVAMVGTHSLLGTELAPHMPTSAQRLPDGIRFDAGFWAENSARLNDRIAALLDGFRGGVRVPAPTRRPAPPPPASEADTSQSTSQ